MQEFNSSLQLILSSTSCNRRIQLALLVAAAASTNCLNSRAVCLDIRGISLILQEEIQGEVSCIRTNQKVLTNMLLKTLIFPDLYGVNI